MKRRWYVHLSWIMLLTWLFLSIGGPRAAADGPVAVSDTTGNNRGPAVAVTADGAIHVAWEGQDGIYYRRLVNGQWTTTEQLSVGGQHPALMVDRLHPDSLYLVWDEPFGDAQDVFIRRWQKGTWGLPRNVSQTDGYSSQPTLAQHADGSLVMVWSDTTPGQPTLYRATSTDGDVWLNAAPLTEMVGAEPHIVVLNDTEHLFWFYRPSFREPRQLFWSTHTSGSWTAPTILSGPISAVSMDAVADERFHLLWLVWNESGDVYVKSWNGSAWSDATALSHDGVDSVAFTAPTSSAPAALWVENGKIRRALRRGSAWNVQDWWLSSSSIADLTTTTYQDGVYVAWAQQEGATWNVWMYDWRPRGTFMPMMMK